VCGRYTSARPLRDLAERFLVEEVRTRELPPSYNIAPTDVVYGVATHHGTRLLDSFSWGLIPAWTRNPAAETCPINARAETLTARPLFREAFTRRRCLLPAEGFYEWQARPGRRKQPYFIRPRDGDLLAFAGLWGTWHGADEVLRTCAIVTTQANQVVGQLHTRMPVIVPPEHWDRWLDPDQEPARLRPLLIPAPETLLEVHPVSTKVNSVRNNEPELIRPVPLEEWGQLL
jgi:Uncharacterized conserved protein